MSKRSNFEKISRDFYPTIDPNAFPLNFLEEFLSYDSYAEPCAGSLDLAQHLQYPTWTSDLEPGDPSVKQKDALTLTEEDLKDCDAIITNPPFTKKVLLPLLDHFITLKPTWLLLPADYMHNQYFAGYMNKCSKVISIGRLYWFVNNWVIEEPVKCEDFPEKGFSKKAVKDDHQKGIKYYTGWWDVSKGKPAKSQYTRGTDNYAWYHWEKDAKECETVFMTRGTMNEN